MVCLDGLRQGTADFAAFPLTKFEEDWGKGAAGFPGSSREGVAVDCKMQTESENSPVWGEEALHGLSGKECCLALLCIVQVVF